MKYFKKANKANHERWLVSYADFITLLFSFFVVMYAISSVNDGKYKMLSDSIEEAFKKPMRSLEAIQFGEISKFLSNFKNNLKDLPVNQTINNPNDENLFSQEIPLDALALKLQQQLKSLLVNDRVQLQKTKDWLEVEVSSKLLFVSGGSLIEEASKDTIKEIAKVFQMFPNNIIVEGFTDNEPISNEIFPSNWELSADRAASVARLLIDYGINSERLSIAGYGSNFPKADNSTAEGREKNRRVVFIILTKNKRVETLKSQSFSNPFAVEPVSDIEISKETIINIGNDDKKDNNKQKIINKDAMDAIKGIRTKNGGLVFSTEGLYKKENEEKSIIK